MPRIALIQNQSEMANYSHADCRSYIEDIGFDYELFTASNIDQLLHSISSGGFDALVIASNALHDTVIRSVLLSATGKKIVDTLQRHSAGLLVLMQYKAAYEDYIFEFLPEELKSLKAIARPDAESSKNSKLVAKSNSFSIPLLTYPHQVRLEGLEDRGNTHKTLKGVYWHHWSDELEPYWDCHLSCTIDEKVHRPLLISAKEHLNSRIIMCALPVDWHGHADLFENMLIYATEGRHQTAVVVNPSLSSPAFDYLLATLRARKEGFQTYHTQTQQLDQLGSNIKSGIHNSIVLGPDVSQEDIESLQVGNLLGLMASGDLRLLSFNQMGGKNELVISGRNSPAKNAYKLIVPNITQELTKGFIDGSFWSTISSLQAIESLPGGLSQSVFPFGKIIEISDKHDRDGSYDEVFGVTVALLWLRSRYFGNDNAKTKKTLGWVRNSLSDIDDSEKIRAYTTLKRVQLIADNEIVAAKDIISAGQFDKANEFELLSYLDASVCFDDIRSIAKIIQELIKRKSEENALKTGWVDMPTTAAFISALVASHDLLIKSKKSNAKTLESIRSLVVPSMIYLEESFQRSALINDERQNAYPWDGKGATTLRCLAAWQSFDTFLSAPVVVAADTIKQISQSGRLSKLATSGLDSIEELVSDREDLLQKLSDYEKAEEEKRDALRQLRLTEKSVRKAVNFSKFLLLLFVILAYFVIDHLARTKFFGEALDFGESISVHSGFHVGVLTLTFAAIATPWKKVFGFIEKFSSTEKNSQ